MSAIIGGDDEDATKFFCASGDGEAVTALGALEGGTLATEVKSSPWGIAKWACLVTKAVSLSFAIHVEIHPAGDSIRARTLPSAIFVANSNTMTFAPASRVVTC
jgi:hypothetical protein